MDQEKITQTSGFAYGLLVFSIIASILVGFFIIRPVYNDNKLKKIIVTDRKEALAKLEENLAKLKELDKNQDVLNQRYEKISVAVPPFLDKARLIYQLDTIASNSGLSLTSISGNEVGSVEGENTEALEAASQSGLIANYLTLNLEGSYDGFLKFLVIARDSLPLFSVSSISIEPEGGRLKINLFAETYTLPGFESLINFKPIENNDGGNNE